MKKSKAITYSIYEEEIHDLSYTPQTFFDRIIFSLSRKSSKQINLTYTFSVPVTDFLRGEVFCTDVSEEMESDFTQRDLISILLDDFLYQAKRRSNPIDLYHSLKDKMAQTNEIQVHSYNHATVTIDGDVKATNTRRRRIECTIKRSEALRLEVMLSDITDLNPEVLFTVEDVLQILYCDFILKYKTGKLSNVLENIIKRLSKNA